VIEAARRIGMDRHPRRLDQRGDARGETGRARRGIMQAIELLGEAAEIVDRPRPRGGRHRRAGHVVMRRHDDDRVGPRQHVAQPAQEIARRARLDEDHRRAVRDEQGGLGGHGPMLRDGSAPAFGEGSRPAPADAPGSASAIS